jgi:hypothetical protein
MRTRLVAAVLLLAAGGLIHSAFFAFVAAVLGLTAVVYLPVSLRRWRRHGQAAFDTPSVRITAVSVGGGALAGAAIYGLLASHASAPRLPKTELVRKLRADLPRYRFALTLPFAAAGAVSLATTRDEGDGATDETRVALVLLLAWSGLVLATYVVFELLHADLPVHRFLAFALAVPILAWLGLLWLGRLVSRFSKVGGPAIVAVGLAAALAISFIQWRDTRAWIDPRKVGDAAGASAYLTAAGIGHDRPIVFIVGPADGSYVGLMGNMIRSALPADRIGEVYVYQGTPENYLARRPTPPDDRHSFAVSARYFGYLQGTYGRNPVALLLASYGHANFKEWTASHPQTVVAPDVAVVRGPIRAIASSPGPSPVANYPWPLLMLAGVGGLALIMVIGAGWVGALFGPDRWSPLESLSLAPAVGIAALVVIGVAVDRTGIRLGGAGAAITIGLALAAGWAVAAVRARRSQTLAEATIRARTARPDGR